MQTLVQTPVEKPNGPLELRVYFRPPQRANAAAGGLQDDGHTFAYQKGEFLR